MTFSQHFTYRKLLSAALSPVVMMLFTSLYSVADGLFLSNFAGKEAFAAVGLMTPYLMMFNSVGFMFGTGGSALIAKLLGEKKSAAANETFSSLVLASICTGLLLSALGQLFLRPVAVLQGTDGALLDNSLISALLSFCRVFAFQIPAVPLLPLLLQLDGIWISVAIAELQTVLLGVCCLLKYRSRYHY